MIDIHSHLIPNVDDGSKSVQETIELIKEGQEAGFTDIILTPHYILDSYEQDIEELKIWTEKLQEILDSKNINVKIHLGMEIYITDNLMDLIREHKVATLAESKYLLMELPMNTSVNYLYDVIFKMINNNIIPIIAHPERYRIVQEDPKIVEELKENGCLIQSNYASIIGVYGKKAEKTIKYLLKNNLVDFLGTDTHRANTIYPKIDKILKKITKIVRKENIDKLTTKNARKILENN